ERRGPAWRNDLLLLHGRTLGRRPPVAEKREVSRVAGNSEARFLLGALAPGGRAGVAEDHRDERLVVLADLGVRRLRDEARVDRRARWRRAKADKPHDVRPIPGRAGVGVRAPGYLVVPDDVLTIERHPLPRRDRAQERSGRVVL